MYGKDYISDEDWKGPGWYTAQQIGAHENQRTVYNFVTDGTYPHDYDCRGRGEGSLVWYSEQGPEKTKESYMYERKWYVYYDSPTGTYYGPYREEQAAWKKLGQKETFDNELEANRYQEMAQGYSNLHFKD